MRAIQAILRTLSDILGAAAALFLAFLMLGTTVDVITRAVTGQPISGIFELTELSLVMLVFLGAMWAQRDDAHIRVTILTDQLSGAAHRSIMAFAWFCGALALAMLAWPATNEAIYSVSIWEFRWGFVKVPIWWTKIGVAVGLWLAAVQMAFYALTALNEPAAR
ncbi:MAG TPA: TRAP transporter small permease [Aurantimonas coralicida]|jgi:TRAP-type C4-dicarboxylate transport system permease small subunit|uniref:TRAP transporter small permease protein n=2 Tax=root TaxID=1 RepID=A0A9C9TIE7_9HYPH|nr:TRAP transporter small permease [Aurantimonas coralicida]HEU02239.1 TRAP transporter small permease [Aurantimonas coralicida]